MHPPGNPLSPAALIHWLGGTAHALPSLGPQDTTLIGCMGPLDVLLHRAPIAEAVRTARKLARTGQPALLIADELDTARRMLCISVPPVRPVIVSFSTPEQSLPLVRLRRVGAAGGRLELALTAAAALDVDAAGRRAFRTLRSGIAQARERLPARLSPDTAHAWVLLQVTRLLFLRFVEAEGWLDGKADFLARSIDNCLRTRRDPERSLIAPLFFGTLNRPAPERTRRALEFGTIPFLNGGLFEPHPMERRRKWRLDAEGWRQLFALLVESFEVTLDRGDVGDRVNPELLGRVFEGTMAPDERKDAGAFYTPMPLVQVILHETVVEHLALKSSCSPDQIRHRLNDRDPTIESALRSLRIIDPAVGSGAFLVAALTLICGNSPASPSLVRRVITRQLFGVDTNPAAVRITELRLWLELLRTMRGRQAARVPPLPNLDTSIRAGNALLDPFAGSRLPSQLIRDIAAARTDAARLHGAPRRRALVRLQRAERAGAIAVLEWRLDSTLALMDDLESGTPRTDLFGHEHQPGHRLRERMTALGNEAAQLRRELARLRRDPTAAVFGIEAAFGSVLASGGFDIVVGNPPWIRAERLPVRERELLSARYRWWHASGSGWQHQPDLAVAFVERGIGLLTEGGTLGFVVPSKLATAGYALSCRAALTHQATIHVAASLHDDPRAEFEATTYPLALVASKRAPANQHEVRLSLSGSERIAQSTWRDSGNWSLSPAAQQQLISRLADLPRLGEQFPASLGVKTGVNDAFMNPPEELAEFTRPALRGRDVRHLDAASSVRLLWPADSRGVPMRSLPTPLARHLAQYRDALEARSDNQRGPWWQLFRTGAATSRWRVIWTDIARRLRAAPLPDPAPVPLNTCYVIPVRNQRQMFALAAWLNSTVCTVLAQSVAEAASGGHFRFGARAVGSLPLPPGCLDNDTLAALGRGPWSEAVAREINRHVAMSLGLSSAEQERFDAFVTTGG